MATTSFICQKTSSNRYYEILCRWNVI